MTDAMVKFEQVRRELDAMHQQLSMGAAIHLPTYHRIVKALEAHVTAIVSQRQQGLAVRPSPWARGCLGKFGYASEQSASVAALRSSEVLETYRCRQCGKWHVGHTRAPMEARRPEVSA
jgi:hypothetical protein